MRGSPEKEENIVSDVVADRRQDLAAETDFERGRFNLFRDRVERLSRKIESLWSVLSEQLAGKYRGNSAAVIEQLNALSKDLTAFSARKDASEERLRALEVRADSISAGFDPERPENN